MNAEEVFALARNNRSWAFRELTNNLREWTPTRIPRTVTATGNVNPLDDLILVSGNSTLTLETAVGADGRRHRFLKTDSSNTMTIACTGSETLSGASTATATAQYQVIGVISNGTNWIIEYSYNSILGAFSLVDPNADRIVFWDDSAGKLDWLSPGNSIAITTTTLDTIQDIRTSASPTFAGATLTALLDISGASAGQIKYPATQNPSANANTQDDYEEGTWTPVLTFATPGDLAISSYTTQTATYTKIGRLIALSFAVVIIAGNFTWTTSSGNAQITGLPFTALTLAGHTWHGALRFGGVTKATFTQVVARIASNNAVVTFGASASAVATALLVAADVPSGGGVNFATAMTYEAA